MSLLLNRRPQWPLRVALGLIPFILLLLVYLGASSARLAENPSDKLLPSLEAMGAAVDRMALEPDRRTGDYLLWQDTWASLKRLGMGVGISALIALVLGVAAGAIPVVSAPVAPLLTAIALIPPLAVLPILFIVFGLGELSKVVLIVVGIAPFLTRDVISRVAELPHEQLLKAQTLGAGTWRTMTRVITPQILPRLIASVRLSLGSAWLFLIAAEAIAATDGLGYRIFLVRRYLAMDVILPYVAWITLLAFALDYGLKLISRRAFPWYHLEAER